MAKTIVVTNEQFMQLLAIAKKDGKVFMKHLPDSSYFHSKIGSWEQDWKNSKGDDNWPSDNSYKDKMVGCHVVDVETREVYIYPKPQSENSSIIGKEDDSFFVAESSLLVPFNLSDATYTGPEESPEEGLRMALSKISFL